MKRTLIVTAHLDDEMFGMGGTLIQMALDDPIMVKVVSLCQGRDDENAKARLEAMAKIQDELQFGIVVYPNYDLELDGVHLKAITKIIEDEIDDFQPERVFVVPETDIHQDHQIVSKATKIACRPSRTSVKELYEFQIPGSEPYTSSHFETINRVNDVFNLKQSYSEYYTSEKVPTLERVEKFRTIYREM